MILGRRVGSARSGGLSLGDTGGNGAAWKDAGSLGKKLRRGRQVETMSCACCLYPLSMSCMISACDFDELDVEICVVTPNDNEDFAASEMEGIWSLDRPLRWCWEYGSWLRATF